MNEPSPEEREGLSLAQLKALVPLIATGFSQRMPACMETVDIPDLLNLAVDTLWAHRSRLQRVDDGVEVTPAPARRCRAQVRAFADLMEAQLKANDHKPGWKGENPFPLHRRLLEECKELFDELQPGSRTDVHAWRLRVGEETADVANFAMMIADVCGALPLPPSEGGM